MKHNFSDTDENTLSKLFPIILCEHNPEWKVYYIKESEYLKTIFGDSIIRINHIGSTSVDGLTAKPTIDILLEIKENTKLDEITEILRDNGYIVNNPEIDVITYLKGYTPNGFEGQAVHIHVRYFGDHNELYFRDYLTYHSNIAEEYAKLKLKLKEIYEFDRDAYTSAKGEFISKYTALARAELFNRYSQ